MPAPFSFLFRARPFLPPTLETEKRGFNNFEQVCESSLLYLLPANPPKGLWIFGFPLGAGINGGFSHGTPLLCQLTCLHLSFFPPHFSLWKQLRIALTAASGSSLAPAFWGKPLVFFFCWLESRVGDALCLGLGVCVLYVCLVLITLWRRLSEWRNHLNLDDGFCHHLLLFKVWPGTIFCFHDLYVSSIRGEGHQGKNTTKRT